MFGRFWAFGWPKLSPGPFPTAAVRVEINKPGDPMPPGIFESRNHSNHHFKTRLGLEVENRAPNTWPPIPKSFVHSKAKRA